MSVTSSHLPRAEDRHLTPFSLPDSTGLVRPAKRYRDPAKSTVERVPNQLVVVHQHPGLMHEAHWHAQIEINFIFRGDVRYRMHGYDATLNQGELAVFWGGLPHQMTDTSDDSEFIAIHLPLVHFFRLHLAPELTHRLTHGATIVVGDLDRNDHGNFNRWSSFMRSKDQARVSHAINELLLRLNRIRLEPFRIIEGGAPIDDELEHIDPQQFDVVSTICNFVADNFCEDIDMDDIASSANVHPKTAMRLFKKSTGMTLYKYLSLLRLSFAQALLMNENIGVLDVAMECGFGSLSAFNTSFARLAGKSPSQFRRDSRAEPNLIL
jgi:AraC-like DNA-binding protein